MMTPREAAEAAVRELFEIETYLEESDARLADLDGIYSINHRHGARLVEYGDNITFKTRAKAQAEIDKIVALVLRSLEKNF